MPAVSCPSCGEAEDLTGERRPDGTLQITCHACETVWERHGDRRCRLCGSADLRYTPKPLWERGRGEQRTPAGQIPAYACWACGGTDVTGSNPRPASAP